MRYYYYGDDTKVEKEKRRAVVPSGNRNVWLRSQDSFLQDQDLIIEDDTVYEIDRDCLRCRHDQKD